MRPVTLFLAIALAVGPAMLLTGCLTAPVSGSKSLDLIDDQDLVRVSAKQFEGFKKRYRISRNKQWNEMLQRVGTQLSQVVFWDVPLADWEFVIFDVPNEVNAFAMPGGKVGVFSGVFQVAQTDDELAVILGHEIAHVAARHVQDRLSREMLRQTGALAVGAATGGWLGLAVYKAYQMGSGFVGLSFDREKERDADRIGLTYMARAGYDPRAAITLWEKMDRLAPAEHAPPEWLSTHPSHIDRLARLIEWMPEAEAAYKETLALRTGQSQT